MLTAFLDLLVFTLISSPIGADNTIVNDGVIDYPITKANSPFEDLFEGFIVGIYD